MARRKPGRDPPPRHCSSSGVSLPPGATLAPCMLPAVKLLMPMLPRRCPWAGGWTGGKLARMGREPVLAARRHTEAFNSLWAWYPRAGRSARLLQQQSRKPGQYATGCRHPVGSAPACNSRCKHASKYAKNLSAHKMCSKHLTKTVYRAAMRL